MLFDLPDDATLYAALVARDRTYDGLAFVGVTSTGVFCPLSCAARKPLARNCRFFATAAECLTAGFRPCRRCHPLAGGARVIDAQLEAGFAAPSAFRDAFSRLTGMAPGHFRPDARLSADWIATPLGPMIAVADDSLLYLLEFPERKALPGELKRLLSDARGQIGIGRRAPIDRTGAALSRYFDGTDASLDMPIAPGGSAFARAVWDEVRRIPAGETRSYSQIAAAIGRPAATRAVARANGANRLALVIPCHRVIGADGALTGYGGGLWRKERLIAMERRFLPQKETLT